MRELYSNQGLEVAVLRVDAEIERLGPCDACGKVPCQCDAMLEKHEDRMMFADEPSDDFPEEEEYEPEDEDLEFEEDEEEEDEEWDDEDEEAW